jgi:TPR repeat protein
LFREAARKHDLIALFGLGCAYDLGLEVPQDYARAAKYYRDAASKGHKEAMNNLGLLYEHGRGVNADGKEAMKLYEKAANLGNVQAAANLARGYASGLGGSKDEVTASMWVIVAAREDNQYIPAAESTQRKVGEEKWMQAESLAAMKYEEIRKLGPQEPLLGQPVTAGDMMAQKR